jgi:hypothetical protein
VRPPRPFISPHGCSRRVVDNDLRDRAVGKYHEPAVLPDEGGRRWSTVTERLRGYSCAAHNEVAATVGRTCTVMVL